MNPDQSNDDLQSRVLQSTLDEISTRQEQDSADCCVICLEFVSEACEAIPCHHRNFDYACLLSWLEHSPKCPLCKATISQVRHNLDKPIANVYVVTEPVPRPSPQGLPGHSTSWRFQRQRPSRQRIPRDRPRSENWNETFSDVVARRRDIYRHNRYSKHVGSNRVSQYRELTPALFCADAELVSRARMWIRRELQVFSFLTLDETDASISRPTEPHPRDAMARRRANNAEFLLEYIIAVLKSVDIMGSGGQAEDMVSDFLGRENTRLFLHELRAWLRSPYTKLQDWDRAVQYDESSASIGSRPEVPRGGANDEATSESRHHHGMNRNISMRGDYYRPGNDQRQKRRASARHAPYNQGRGRVSQVRRDEAR
ncbi:hypothetical protein B0T10DRAFT_164858 [Thelonectria olida]|uniref:RING-type E3 ubiquitin transferase n=1 Tax=Thelonectria olida TaxID=1576542 RepID=A0A9P9AX02_9HYPO|nr:hypothetical protein B0T10DRAFT_164858 [Thelonectria olida]